MHRNRRAAESKEQKIFNLIVSIYLNSQAEEIKPFPISDEFLQLVNLMNLNLFKGTNFVTFKAERVFSESDLKKLKDIKVQALQIENELKLRKEEVNFIKDAEITSAHKTYMDRLHRYNEAKDMAQALMGKLAQLAGTTTRNLYPNFDLCFDD
jgi:hypothetical protein